MKTKQLSIISAISVILLAVLQIPLAFGDQSPINPPAILPVKPFDNFTTVKNNGSVPRVIDDNDRVVSGNVHPNARPEFDVGATDPSLKADRMILSLRIRTDKQAELDNLLAEQQDPTSPNFHKWLTPEEFGRRFGPTDKEITAVTGWLTSHGFTIDEVAKGRTWINFSGTISDVQRAFRTQIHNFNVDGQLHRANKQNPSIPRALADLVNGVVSLNDFFSKPMHSGGRTVSSEEIQPQYTAGGSHYLAPGDFATIYNVNPLYNAGIDGTGVDIAIVGRTNPPGIAANWNTFRNMFGLPNNPPQVVVNGADPGDQGAGENLEANLDVEWAGAVARNAHIIFVTSRSVFPTDGVTLSAQFIVNNNLAPVMSTSFSVCETQMLQAQQTLYRDLWAQAATQGITSFVASGDYGAAGCITQNNNGNTTAWGLGVNGLASTPSNVAVGGTQFNEGAGAFWNTTNGTGGGSAISYIPEVAWNESNLATCGVAPNTFPCLLGATTGGGVSTIYTKPAWQVTPGVPADGRRDLPDVSLNSSGSHDGYLVCSQGLCDQGSFNVVGGTSAASPAFAGILALIVQRAGQWQGNVNTRLYPLANAQYGPGGAAVFHDITTGNNSVPNVTGFTCTAGYDRATGLGSVDANVLVNNWTVPPGQTYQLSVAKSYRGKSFGSVTPNSGSITWSGNTGTANYFSSTFVTLTATPSPGSVFAGWSGCSGVSGRICNVVMNSNTSVTATFVPDITPIINLLLLD